jgi:hypothetical protein
LCHLLKLFLCQFLLYSDRESCFLFLIADEADLKGTVAAIGFILRSASRYGVDSASLDSELQQLGLPRELAAALSKTHTDNTDKLANLLAESSLRRKFQILLPIAAQTLDSV